MTFSFHILHCLLLCLFFCLFFFWSYTHFAYSVASLFHRLRPGKGETILDVGSGLGLNAIAIAEKGAKVIGYDNSQAAISRSWANLALTHTKEHHLNINFQKGTESEVVSIFGSASFDAVFISRLLEHVESPRETLKRLSKVLKRGGRIVVCEPDWQTLAIDHPNQKYSDIIINLFENSVRHPYVGRKLRRLLRELGFIRLTMRAVPVVFVDPVASGLIGGIQSFVEQGILQENQEEVNYVHTLQQMKAETAFTSGLTMYVLMGERPSKGQMIELPRILEEKVENKDEELNHFEQESEKIVAKVDDDKIGKEHMEVPAVSPAVSPAVTAVALPAVPTVVPAMATDTSVLAMTPPPPAVASTVPRSEDATLSPSIEGEFQFVTMKDKKHAKQEGVVKLPTWPDD